MPSALARMDRRIVLPLLIAVMVIVGGRVATAFSHKAHKETKVEATCMASFVRGDHGFVVFPQPPGQSDCVIPEDFGPALESVDGRLLKESSCEAHADRPGCAAEARYRAAHSLNG